MIGYRSHQTSKRAILFLTIAVLCLGVCLQILGVSISFLDLNGSDDVLSNSILTGFATLSNDPWLSPLLRSLFAFIATASFYQAMLSYRLFRPPLVTV
jgi:hypothetical protein